MKLTVSILCYNYGRFLAQAIESALSQELRPEDELEVVVVDDGSTDETEEVCEKYQGRIKVIRSSNQGFGASLTKAIRHASGEYVFLLDADDYFAPGKVEAIRPYLDGKLLFVEHDQYCIDEAGRRLPGVAHGGNTSTMCVYRAAALTLLPAENEIYFGVLGSVGRHVQLKLPLTNYRIHGNSMTNRKVPGKQNDYLAGVHLRLSEFIAAMNPLPEWIPSEKRRVQLVREFSRTRHYNELESALERGQRKNAWQACVKMLADSVGSISGVTPFTLKMVVKTLLMRPSFPKDSR